MEYYITFIAVMFIAVCWIWGFEYTFKEGEIFGKLGQAMRKEFPEWVTKPLIDCKYCMASVHGTIMFAVFLSGLPVYMWVIFCFGCCGMTAIFDNK